MDSFKQCLDSCLIPDDDTAKALQVVSSIAQIQQDDVVARIKRPDCASINVQDCQNCVSKFPGTTLQPSVCELQIKKYRGEAIPLNFDKIVNFQLNCS